MSDARAEQIRVGVFVCHCGKNIGGVIDAKAVAEFSKDLPDVVYSTHNIYTCSESGQNELKKAINEHGINRVVVAACSPKMHEATFRTCISEAGVNQYLLEMANIREHDSWVHMHEPAKATKKAMNLVKMAVVKARLLDPLQPLLVPVNRKALIIGGGVAGMRAALDLANAGHGVILVEKTATLGGKTLLLDKTFPKVDCTWCQLQEMMNKVLVNEHVRVLTLSRVTDVKGYVGNFTVTVRTDASGVNEGCIGCRRCTEVCPVAVPEIADSVRLKRKAIYMTKTPVASLACHTSDPGTDRIVHITSLTRNPEVAVVDSKHCTRCGACINACPVQAIDPDLPSVEQTLDVGAIVLATGFDLYNPKPLREFGYGKYADVVTSLELERMLNPLGPTRGNVVAVSGGLPPKRVSFIQCVGCRDDRANSFCGRICCMISLKQAILLKERYPDCDITIFYTDMRTGAKEYEAIYAKAQRLGIRFVRGRPGNVLGVDGRLFVRSEDTLTSQIVEEESDMVILAAGIQASEDTAALSEMLKVPRDQHGFFMEAHIKLKPVETVIDGVVLAGSCSAPMDIPMSIARGHATAAKILSLFSRDHIELEPITSYVDLDKCKGCLSCVEMCPFQAIKPTESGGKKHVELLASSCKGCGTCVAGCPFNALSQHHFTDAQIYAQIDAALEENPRDTIVSFNCNWCSYAGADFAGVSRLQYPTDVRIIRVMCSGRISQGMILRAFEKDAGMVIVAPCHPSDCHYISGNVWAKRRIEQLGNTLIKKGINPDRVRLVYVSAAEGNVYQRAIVEATALLQKMKSGEVSWSTRSEETLKVRI